MDWVVVVVVVVVSLFRGGPILRVVGQELIDHVPARAVQY